MAVDFSAIKSHDLITGKSSNPKRAISATLLLAEQTKGLLHRPTLLGLFRELGINRGGQQRVFDILDRAFLADDYDTDRYYVPVNESDWDCYSKAQALYTTTKSGMIIKDQVMALFVGNTPRIQASIDLEKKMLVLENNRLQKEVARANADMAEYYQKWLDALDELKEVKDNALRIHKDKLDAERREKAWRKMAEHVNAILALLPQVDDSGTFTPPAVAAVSN